MMPRPLNRNPLRITGSTTLISIEGFVRRFFTVWGEARSANIKWSSSRAVTVPFGERFAVPSSQIVAAKPSRCSSTIRRISGLMRPTVAE